jgi:hypothetical protein
MRSASQIAVELGNARAEILAQKAINKKSRAIIIRLSDQAEALTQELLTRIK